MHELLRDLTPPLFRRLVKRAGIDGRAKRHRRSGLRPHLEPYLPPGRGYYVELGANDGIVQSNTYWLEYERRWHGLLIEPALNRYFDLRRNRSHANDFACAACVPFGYTDEFVAMTYANLRTVSRDLVPGLGDTNHPAAAQGSLKPNEERVVFGAPARTLQSLLDEAGAPATVDLLSLDVEGAELSVLRGVDHEITRFRLIVVESWDIVSTGDFLRSRDYSLVTRLSHHDYLFADSTA